MTSWWKRQTDTGIASLASSQISHLLFSGADCANLAREASMGPLRDKLRGAARDSPDATLRAIEYRDFVCALRSIRASVSKHDLDRYETWNDTFGTVAYVQEKAS